MDDIIECDCSHCQSACKHKPGWFAPGEIKGVAEFLGVTEKELFDTHLAVDYYHLGEGNWRYSISPAIKGATPGQEFPFYPKGECVFFKDGKCSIHPVKPEECRLYDHRKSEEDGLHELVSKKWEGHQEEITELLGREPKAAEPTLAELLKLTMMSHLGMI